MSNTFFPLFKTNLKISFDFRGKKQKASMLTILIVISLAGMAFSALYGFIFAMAAMETNTPLINVLYMMGGFASLLALSTTIPKVKSTLFGGNDYDMLAAMPIPKKEILFVKFFSLYLVEFFYSIIILLPAGIICFICDNNVNYLLHTILMVFLVPVLPLLLACLVGTFISLIADRSKFGNIISIIFYMAFIVLIMSTSMMTSSGDVADMSPMFNLFKWFNPTSVLLEINIPIVNYIVYIISNIVLLVVVIILLTFFYDHIHDLLSMARTNKKSNVKQELKINTPTKSLLKVELKKYFSSRGYLMNTIVGGILSIVMVGMIAVSLFSPETEELAAIIKEIIPYLSLLIMWCIGMSTPSTSAISMEGKNFWIIKSMPIDYKKYLKTKIILSELVLAPFALIASIVLTVFSKISVEGVLVIFLLPQLYLLSMNYISLVLNTRFYKLNWSNEMEVVKQSKCVLFAMLIDFVYTGIVSALLIALGILVGLWAGAIASIVFTGVMVLISRNTLYKKCPNRLQKIEN